ncbi:MAG: hypothetical protein JXA21_16795 [Anaerolineae bacterium]|nr:hypothetical protein [Anaerolineae bacterium]
MAGAVLTVEEAVQLVKLARVVPMRHRASEAVIALLRAREERAPEPAAFSPQKPARLAGCAQSLQVVA